MEGKKDSADGRQEGGRRRQAGSTRRGCGTADRPNSHGRGEETASHPKQADAAAHNLCQLKHDRKAKVGALAPLGLSALQMHHVGGGRRPDDWLRFGALLRNNRARTGDRSEPNDVLHLQHAFPHFACYVATHSIPRHGQVLEQQAPTAGKAFEVDLTGRPIAAGTGRSAALRTRFM